MGDAHTAARPPLSRAQRLRYALYAVGVTASVLLVLDAVLGGLFPKSRNATLWEPGESPWRAEADGRFHARRDGPMRVAEHPFRVEKGDAWRVFFVGGSFLRGVPYDEVGTIHRFFEERLLAGHPSVPVEVVNASMSAQPSDRVRENVNFALEHAPDLLVVATCNNEGTLPPSAVTRTLHASGAFRALRAALRGDEAVPTHTLQNPDTAAVREHFRENLRAIVDATAARGVPLLLCTLPLNLRYAGDESGLPLDGATWEAPGTWPVPACLTPGRAAYLAGQYADAVRLLAPCEEAETLRWLGLAHAALGHAAAARDALEQYVELMPRNRCRPSFQAVIREEATRSANVTLVDLDAHFRAGAPLGLPGDEVFTDYCHLRWDGQAQVADLLISAVDQAGLAPKGSGPRGPLPDRAAAVEAARLAGLLRAPAEQPSGGTALTTTR